MSTWFQLVAVCSLALLLSPARSFAQEPVEKEWVCDKCGHQFPNPTTPSVCPKCKAKFGAVVKTDGTTAKTKQGEDRETLKTVLMVVAGLAILGAVAMGIVRFLKSSSEAKKPKNKKSSKPRRREDD